MGRGQDPEKQRDPTKRPDDSRSQRASRRAAERRAARAQEAKTKRKATSEEVNRRWIIGGVLAVILIAVGFIGFGWYQSEIKPLDKTVLRVEETKYNLAHLERRMELELDTGGNFSRNDSSLLNLPDFVLASLEGEAALLAGLDDLELEVTDEDVAAEIRSRGGLADDVEPSVFADEVKNQVEESGLKQNEYELMIRAFLAEQKVRDYFLFLGPTDEEQVRGRMIIVEDEETARGAIERIEGGEDFMSVAEEVTLDPNLVQLDWFPRGGEPTVFEDVEDYFFEGELNTLSGPIHLRDFYYVVEVQERDPSRELSEEDREAVADREVADFITELRESLDIETNFTQDDAVRALEDIL